MSIFNVLKTCRPVLKKTFFHSIPSKLSQKLKKVVERKNNYILRHIANSYVSKISLSNSTCFRQIQGAGLKLNQRSAICFALKATFLGHQVSNEVIQPNGEKKIQELQTPKNVTEVIQILGLHYRHFVPNSAETMRPLIDLTKKNKEFIWSKSGEQAFMKLKQILSKPNILSYLINDDGKLFSWGHPHSSLGWKRKGHSLWQHNPE